MKPTRRQFAVLWGVATGASSFLGATFLDTAARRERVLERRAYDRGGVVPPRSVLRRCGMERLICREGKRHVEFLIAFDSPAERARAWDRFNCDPEWCALRAGGDVRLTKISIGPPD